MNETTSVRLIYFYHFSRKNCRNGKFDSKFMPPRFGLAIANANSNLNEHKQDTVQYSVPQFSGTAFRQQSVDGKEGSGCFSERVRVVPCWVSGDKVK